MQPTENITIWPKNVITYISTVEDGNMALHVLDDPEQVAQNRAQLVEKLQLPENPRWLNQVHGHQAVRAETVTQPIDADASFTEQPNVVCAVMTADCLPLLITNRQGTEVAAIHAGWPGLLDGVIEATIEALSSKPEDLLVYLGHAIGPKALELNETIYQDYISKYPEFAQGFELRTDGSIYADIYQLSKIVLARYNITSVFGGKYCTYTQDDQFFSYRRQGKRAGRMISLIFRQDVLT